MNELPIARGLILCEKLVFEEVTRNSSLINCFFDRRVTQLPTAPMDFVLYALLLNGRGRIRLEVLIERLNSSALIDRRSGLFDFSDPKREFRFRTRYSAVSFQEAGDYEFQLWADSELIANTILRIRLEEQI